MIEGFWCSLAKQVVREAKYVDGGGEIVIGSGAVKNWAAPASRPRRHSSQRYPSIAASKEVVKITVSEFRRMLVSLPAVSGMLSRFPGSHSLQLSMTARIQKSRLGRFTGRGFLAH